MLESRALAALPQPTTEPGRKLRTLVLPRSLCARPSCLGALRGVCELVFSPGQLPASLADFDVVILGNESFGSKEIGAADGLKYIVRYGVGINNMDCDAARRRNVLVSNCPELSAASVATFDLPARHSLVPSLLPREDLPNAISLNGAAFQLASVVGPSLAGVVIAAAGVGWTYALNGLSFLCVIVALLMMRDLPRRDPSRDSGSRDDVSMRAALEGVRFVFRSPLIRPTMLLDFFATFFSSATALLPIFAQDILHVGAWGYGWLYAAPAVGAVAAGVAMVVLTPRIRRRGVTLLWAVAGYGLATAAFGISRSFWVAFVCLALTGVTDTVGLIIRNIIRQLETPDRLRGRVTGINIVFYLGGPQLGGLEAGAVASRLGAPFSVVSGGLACLAAVAWVAARTPLLRRYGADAARPNLTNRPKQVEH